MQRHINKKILCTRTIESYSYDDNKLNELSLIRIYDKKEDEKINFICKNCNKSFISNSSLKRHNTNYCKNKSEEENSCCNEQEHEYEYEKDKKERECNNQFISHVENIETLNHIIDNSTTTINNITNNTTHNNTTINNVNFNINITKSFDEDWDTSKIEISG
jgi:hypothetical protein